MSDNKMPDKVWVLQNEAGRFWFEKPYPEHLDGDALNYTLTDLVNLKTESIPISELKKLLRKYKKHYRSEDLYTIPDGSHIKDLQNLIDKGSME